MTLPTPSLHDRIAQVLNDDHWSVHEVIERAAFQVRQGVPADAALAWLIDLDPQAAAVVDEANCNLAWPLFNHPMQEDEAIAFALFDVLVKAGLDVNHAMSPGVSLLDRATLLDVWEGMVLRLLDAGAHPDQRLDMENNTLMHVASPSLIPALVARGVPLNERNAQGMTPLRAALQGGADATSLALLDAGADPSSRSNGPSSLLTDANNPSPMVVTRLLMAGLDPNGVNDQGLSPLQKTVSFAPLHPIATPARAAVVAVLIGAGADVNASSPKGDNVAALAAGMRHLDLAVLQALANAGADLEQVSKDGHSAHSRLERRAMRSEEITPDEVRVLLDTSVLRRTLADLSSPASPTLATDGPRGRARL